MDVIKYIFALFFLIPATLYANGVPHTFINGEFADAAKVNENFSTLATNINNIRTLTVATSIDNSGYTVASCPNQLTAISVSCECSGSPTTNSANYGSLMSCKLISQHSFIGICHNIPGLYDPNLPGSPVIATAMCADVTLSTPPAAKALSSGQETESTEIILERLKAKKAAMDELAN